MKKIALTLLMGIIGMNTFAQDANTPPKKATKKKTPIVRPIHCPAIYISTSTGINNSTGLLGFSIDVPVDKNISIEGGPGISSWGYKVYIGAKYYLQPCQRGWAFGTGLTYNTGIQGYQRNMETVTGYSENVQLNLNPQTNILFAAYKYWNLGKRYNRFYMELGWSVPLSGGNKFDQTLGDPIDDRSTKTMNFIAPGGLIAAVGFSFGVH